MQIPDFTLADSITPRESRAESIVAAAAPLFDELGFVGASTRALASAAGCNVATLAYHFGNKEGLYHAVLDAQYATLLAMALPEDLPEDREDRVRTVVAAVYRYVSAHPAAIRILMSHTLRFGRHPEPVLVRWRERTLERLAAWRSVLDLPPLDTQLALVSLGHLIARYAVTNPSTLGPFVEGDVSDGVSDHLGDVAVAMLL